ncbi:hypothetical protein LguiB_034055 [Lonicera macranthoides]
MASSTKEFSLFFLLITFLSSSIHIHARDSQFFSKVTNPNTNLPKENEIPTKKENEVPLNKEQEPNFIPQGQNGAYGLYGHESGQLPPVTTTTTPSTTTGGGGPYSNSNNNEAYVTEPQGMSDTRFMEKGYTTPINSNNYNNGDMYNPEKQGSYYNGENNMYNSEKQGMSETKFMEKGYTTPINNYNYNDGKMYNPEKQEDEANNYYNGDNNMYNSQKQGMSDTRFMEKGYTTPINNYNNGGNTYNPEKEEGEANNYYNGDNNMYNSQKQGMSDTRFMEKGYTTPINSYKYNNEASMYNPEKQGYSTPTNNYGGNMNNNQKLGMSDTRFLENGKYYYDLNNENYNSLNANDNSRGVDSRYEYNSRGNYGNNGNSYEFNNNNNNSMEEYHIEEDLP